MRRTQRGFGLIEVLVAVLVMAIGLLGIAALQATALRNSQSAMERSQAVIYTYGILDAMRANRAVAVAGGYDMTVAACDVPADPASLIEADHAHWVQSLKRNLGDDACGAIACDADSCSITVQWNDSRATGGDAAAETHSVTTQTWL